MLKDKDDLRFKIYAVAAAVGAILVAKGIITEKDLDLYKVLIEALLLLVVLPNTRRDSGDVPEVHDVNFE